MDCFDATSPSIEISDPSTVNSGDFCSRIESSRILIGGRTAGNTFELVGLRIIPALLYGPAARICGPFLGHRTFKLGPVDETFVSACASPGICQIRRKSTDQPTYPPIDNSIALTGSNSDVPN